MCYDCESIRMFRINTLLIKERRNIQHENMCAVF